MHEAAGWIGPSHRLHSSSDRSSLGTVAPVNTSKSTYDRHYRSHPGCVPSQSPRGPHHHSDPRLSLVSPCAMFKDEIATFRRLGFRHVRIRPCHSSRCRADRDSLLSPASLPPPHLLVPPRTTLCHARLGGHPASSTTLLHVASTSCPPGPHSSPQLCHGPLDRSHDVEGPVGRLQHREPRRRRPQVRWTCHQRPREAWLTCLCPFVSQREHGASHPGLSPARLPRRRY